MAQIGPDHPDTLAAQLNLGNALAESGDVRAARTLLEMVVRGYASALGPVHSRTLRALMNLAVVIKQSDGWSWRGICSRPDRRAVRVAMDAKVILTVLCIILCCSSD